MKGGYTRIGWKKLQEHYRIEALMRKLEAAKR